jgi:CheY-like chemotaxis protein
MAPASSTRRILVIDDEYAIRVLLKSFLEGHDYEVRLAEDGENALRIFQEFQPEVIISDIMMPVESGLSIVSRIRERSPSIKVIYLSAWLDETDTEIRLNEELDNHPAYKLIKKPFDLDALLKVIEELSSPS